MGYALFFERPDSTSWQLFDVRDGDSYDFDGMTMVDRAVLRAFCTQILRDLDQKENEKP